MLLYYANYKGFLLINILSILIEGLSHLKYNFIISSLEVKYLYIIKNKDFISKINKKEAIDINFFN